MRASDEKLMKAFQAAGMLDFANRAAQGEFNEFFGPYTCGITFLVEEMTKVGTPAALQLRKQLINGDFDAGIEESEEWANSPEGIDTFQRLVKGK